MGGQEDGENDDDLKADLFQTAARGLGNGMKDIGDEVAGGIVQTERIGHDLGHGD